MPDTDAATDLIIIRHGQTKWNLEGRAQGHEDSPLTCEGVGQAVAVGRRLASMNLHALYSSDLGRAVQTANSIGEQTGLVVRVDPRLREQNLGVFEGLTAAERVRLHPEANEVWQSKDPDARIPEGESMRDRYELAVGCLEQLAADHPGRRVAIVTHGGILNAVFRRCMVLPLNGPRTFVIVNASVNVIRVKDGRWSLVTWGDVSHLDSRAQDEL